MPNQLGKLFRVMARTYNKALLPFEISSVQAHILATLWIERRNKKPVHVVATPRIGVDYAGEWAQKPWRFVDADSPHLSRKLR